MAGWRRRRDDAWPIKVVVQLAAFAFLFSFISPEVRQVLAALGSLAICLVGLVFIGVLGWLIYPMIAQLISPPPMTLDIPCDAPGVDAEAESGMPVVRGHVPTDASPGERRNERANFQTTADLIKRLRAIDWFQFEKLVALVYRKLGYTVMRRGGANPDGGIDLLIEKAGHRSAVQCKHWRTWNVGVKTVREFLGALTDAGISKGILITLCGYTGEAKQLADKHAIEIVNETGLAKMIEATDARSDPQTLAIINDTRKFCPKCESELVLRTAKKGIGAGGQFWGCSAYPRCRFILRV